MAPKSTSVTVAYPHGRNAYRLRPSISASVLAYTSGVAVDGVNTSVPDVLVRYEERPQDRRVYDISSFGLGINRLYELSSNFSLRGRYIGPYWPDVNRGKVSLLTPELVSMVYGSGTTIVRHKLSDNVVPITR